MRGQEAVSVLAVLRSDETKETLTDLFAEMQRLNVEMVVGALNGVSDELIARHSPDVLLVDLDLSDSSEIDTLATIIRTHGSDLGIIATSSDVTLEGVRRLMRLDVADFVPQPIAQAELTSALEHAVHKGRRAEIHVDDSKAKIFSIVRPVGGVGASMIAVQTACSLAERVKSEGERAQVCLLDLDIQFGNAAIYLDVDSEFSVVDLLHAQGKFDAAYLRGLMFHHKLGIDVLSPPTSLLPLDTLTPEFMMTLLEVVSEEYRYVVIDTPHALTDWTQVVLGRSDVILLVTQLSVGSLRQTRRFLDFLAEEGGSDIPVVTVLNRFQKRYGDKVGVKDAEKALGRSLDYFIPNDYKTVSAALDAGVSLSSVRRNNKVAKRIDELVESCLERIAPGVSERAEPTLRAS
jgi:pilus assembly protein CpaE